jgi:MFS family permease
MTVTKKQLENNLWKFYLTKLEVVTIAVPIITIYMLSKGLSIAEIFTLQAIFGLMLAALELPTGAISDLVGRKKTIILSFFFYAIGLTLYGFVAATFYGFLFAEAFFAVGSALLSGTDSAFLYDTLKKLNRVSEYKKIYSNANAFYLLIGAAFLIIGGFLASISLVLPLKAAAIAGIILFFIMFTLVEPPFKRSGFSKNKYINQMKKNVIFTFTHKRVRWLTIFLGITTSSGILGFWYYQPYMQVVNLDLAYFGIVFAGLNVVAAIASKFATKIEEKIGEFFSLIIMGFLPVATLFIAGRYFATIVIGTFCFQQIGRGMQKPIVTSYINEHLDSSNRATVLSMSGLFGRLIGFIVLPTFGYLVDAWSLGQSMLFAGISFAVVFLTMFFVKPKD